MFTAWQLQTPSVLELIALEDAKLHCRVDAGINDDDGLLARVITGAVSQIEAYLGRGLLTQTWKYQQAQFTDEIVLPMAAPLQSVTSVKYYDASGALVTLASSAYVVDTVSEPGLLFLAPNQVWPQTQAQRRQAVEVTYVVGFASVDRVPGAIVDAAFLLIGDRYANREGAELPRAVEALLAPHRMWWREPREACAS